jgi:hypothetical protein
MLLLSSKIRPRRQSDTRIKCILYQLQPGPSPKCYPIPVRRWRTTEQWSFTMPINITKHMLVYVLHVLSTVSREGTAPRQSEPGCMRSTRGQLSSSLALNSILVTVLSNKPHLSPDAIRWRRHWSQYCLASLKCSGSIHRYSSIHNSSHPLPMRQSENFRQSSPVALRVLN